jgi:O-antigen biosynthesis protein
MDKRAVYTKFNSYRKAEFNLRTEVVIEDGKTYIYKVALYEEGKEFIQHIYNSYKKLSILELPFNISRCELIDEKTLRFDYIKGKTLLKEFEEVAKSNDLNKFLEKFKEFEELLNQLPSKKDVLGKEFEKVFGPYEEGKEYELLFPGILDLNLDNIIRDVEGNLHLIDYEWCFDFGIPKKYVLYRTVLNTFVLINTVPEREKHLKTIENEFLFSEKITNQSLIWEDSFQKFVSKSHSGEPFILRNIALLNNSDRLEKTLLTEKKQAGNCSKIIYEKEQEINRIKTEKEMEINRIEIEKENEINRVKKEKEKEIDRITNKLEEFDAFKKGLIWKFLEKYRSFKRKMKKIVNYLKYLSSIRSKDEFKRYTDSLSVRLYQLIHKSDKVTVVIPVWNRTKKLEDSINSILRQSYKDLELILVTDGSPQETLSILRKYQNNFRVKIFYYFNNSGNAVRGRNKAIREATGKYFAFQDSDDIAEKHRIKTSVKYLKKHNIDGVYGGWRALLDGTRNDTGLENKQEVFSPDCDIELMKKNCVPCQSTVMIKTEVLRKLGGLKQEMKYREDHELWLRFMDQGYTFKAIPKVLTNLRLHSQNAELLFKNDDKKWEDLLVKKYKEKSQLKEKIAYIIPSTGVSGGVAVIIQHANRLIKRGYDVMLISEDDKTKIKWMKCYAQVIPLHTRHSYYLDNIDLLIATGWSTAKYLKQIDSKRKLYFIQSDERRFFEKGEEKTIKKVEKTYKSDYEFFTEAIWIQKWLKDEFNKDAYYVPNGLDQEIFYKTKPLQKKNKKIRILLEGPICIWFKGMTDAYYSVKDLDCEIWIVSGAGKPPSYWRYDRFFEGIPIEKMKKVYSSCDILLKMSRVEGFFGPPLEAMTCGCVPVVSKVTGYDEYIKDGYNALVIEMGDTEGAKKAIQKLIDNPKLMESLKKNGKKTASEWTWERSVDYLEKVIKKEKVKKFYNSKSYSYSYRTEMKKVYNQTNH